MDLALEILEEKENYIKWIVSKFKISRNDADNYLSECMLKLFERKNGSPIEFNRGYIYAVIRNLIINNKRKRKPDIVYTDDLNSYDKCQLRNQNQNYIYKKIRNEVNNLKYIYKECLILKFRFGLTQYEIAKLLNISHGTVAPRIMKGQIKLRREFLNAN